MKNLIIVFSLFVSISGSSQRLPDFLSRSERKFIKNVTDIYKEDIVNITKSDNNHIVVEFETTKVELKPDGFVGEIWILEDKNWLSLGTEELSY